MVVVEREPDSESDMVMRHRAIFDMAAPLHHLKPADLPQGARRAAHGVLNRVTGADPAGRSSAGARADELESFMRTRVELLRLDRRATARRARRRDNWHRGPRGRWCLFHPGVDFGRRDYDPARTAQIRAGGSARRRYSRGRRLIGARMAAGSSAATAMAPKPRTAAARIHILRILALQAFLSYSANTSIGSPAH